MLKVIITVLLVIWASLINQGDAGQTCASCTGSEGMDDCLNYTTCNNDEVCHVIVYTNEEGQILNEYGCAAPLACHHSVDSVFVGRREIRHDMCSVCCNSTRLCNLKLSCDSPAMTPPNLPRDCSDMRKTGTYTIYPYASQQHPVSVYCWLDSAGLSWTVFQRRFDGSLNFYRNWTEYKDGFGAPPGEYWLGNEVVHELTSYGGNHHLRVVMTDFANVTKFAEYGKFSLGDENDKYQLHVQQYSGTAGDALTRHNGYKFTTFDNDNDVYGGNCANRFYGAWWYDACHSANLNGRYLHGAHGVYANGTEWQPWHGDHYSLKATMMMLRRF